MKFLSPPSSATAVVAMVTKERWVLPAAVAFLALLAYANSFPGAFIQDDKSIVLTNPMVRDFDFSAEFFQAIFRLDYWGATFNSGLYRPLTTLSLAVNRLLLGHEVWGYHLVNVLLHGTVSCLAGVALSLWGLPVSAAWLAAALFAVHPMHTEVVDQVVGRSELLVAFFLLAAFCVARRMSRGASVVTILLFLLALLSKEHAVAFIVLLPLCDAFCHGSFDIWRQRWGLYVGLSLTLLLWLAWRTLGVEQSVPPMVPDPVYAPLAYLPWAQRVLTAVKLQGLYLFKLVLPVRLQAYYMGEGFPGVVKGLFTPAGLLTTVSAAGTVLAARWGWRRRSKTVFLGICYLLAFLPTANIFFATGVTFAERLAYFPSLWFCAAISALLVEVWKPSRRPWLGLGAALFVIALLTTATWSRNLDYRDEITLWKKDLTIRRSNPVAWLSLGEALLAEGRQSEAEEAFRQMLAVRPDFSGGWSLWAAFLLRTGRFEQAIEAASRSLQIRSGVEDVRTGQDRGTLAEAYLLQGEYRQSLLWLDRGGVVEGFPSRTMEIRGKALAGLGRYAEAVKAFEAVPPGEASADLPVQLGICLLRLGRLVHAGQALEFGYREMGVDTAPLWNVLGVVRARQGRWAEAIQSFARAADIAPQNSRYQENLRRARLGVMVDSMEVD